MNNRDELFRVWYNNYLGTKSESFAYDVWCAAWAAGWTDAEYKIRNHKGESNEIS